jgi:hypothetical protein
MLRLIVCAIGLAACSSSRATDPPMDPAPAPVTAVELPLEIVRVPGDPVAVWPTPIVYAGGRHLLPFRDASGGLHARMVEGDGLRDFDLGTASFIGAVAHGDRFVVVTAVAGAAVVHVLDDEGDRARIIPASEAIVPGVASDGECVLVVTGSALVTDVGAPRRIFAHALLLSDGAAQAELVELGSLPDAPALFGDADGFIVAGNLLLSSVGDSAWAPAQQLPGARVFHSPTATRDRLTFDGDRWLALDAPADWAVRDATGITVSLPDGNGQKMLHVGVDLTSSPPEDVPRSSQVPAWLDAVRGDRALWQGLQGSDHVFAILDADTLSSRGTFVRVSNAATRTVVASLGDEDALLVWISADGSFAYARYPR